MAYQKNILILLFFYTVIKELCLIKFQIITLLCITNLSINKQKLCLNYLSLFQLLVVAQVGETCERVIKASQDWDASPYIVPQGKKVDNSSQQHSSKDHSKS